MVCHSPRGPGHEVALVRHGPWICVSDGGAAPAAGDLEGACRYMRDKGFAPRIGFFAARGGAAPGLKTRRRRRQR